MKLLTWRGKLYGLCMFMREEKLKFRGTLAPRKGRNLYGFGTPTPNTWNDKQYTIHSLIKINGPRIIKELYLGFIQIFGSKIQDFFQTFSQNNKQYYCLCFQTQGYQNSQPSFFHDALQTYSNKGAMQDITELWNFSFCDYVSWLLARLNGIWSTQDPKIHLLSTFCSFEKKSSRLLAIF